MRLTSAAIFFLCATCCLSNPSMAADTVPAFALSSPDGHSGTILPLAHWGLPKRLIPSTQVIAGKTEILFESDFWNADPTLGRIGADPDLASEFSAAEFSELQERLRCAGVRTKPEKLMLALVEGLSRAPCDVSKRAHDEAAAEVLYPMEQIFLRAARLLSIPQRGMETGREQMSVMGELPRDALVREIKLSLSQPYDKARETRAKADFAAGRFDSMPGDTFDTYRDPAYASALVGRLITDRNRKFAQRITGAIATGAPVIVVGAAHIGGPEGLAAMLGEAGLVVTPVTLPSLTDEDIAQVTP